MRSQRVPMVLTSLGEYELGTALRFAGFRIVILPGEARLFWADFEADRASVIQALTGIKDSGFKL